MSFKFLSAIALGVFCALVGVYYSAKYSIKSKFYDSLYMFNCDFEINVNFFKNNLKNALSKNYNCKLFNNYLKLKKDNINNDSFFKEKQLLKKYFSIDEIYLISEYFNKLGKTDGYNQEGMLKAYQKIFDKKRTNSQQEDLKKGVLLKKISVLIGLITFILAV